MLEENKLTLEFCVIIIDKKVKINNPKEDFMGMGRKMGAALVGGTPLLLAGRALAQIEGYDPAELERAQREMADALSAAAVGTAGAAAVGIGMMIFWFVFAGVGFILWLWALIDLIKREFKNSNDKILWLILVLLIPWIGPIAYLIAGRKGTKAASSAESK